MAVYQYLGSVSSFPTEQIVERVVQWAIHLNYGIRQKPPARSWLSISVKVSGEDFAPDCQKLLALTANSQEAHARWLQFQVNEAALYHALVNQCQRAISQRTETSSGSSGISDF